MRKIILSVVFILLFSASFAQKIQFGNATNTWSLIDSTIGCCVPHPVVYSTAHYDSIPVNYNGFTYQYLISSVASFLIREDSGRVYIISTTDSFERLLYDFNLGVNDTIRNNYPYDKYVTWVTQIDSTQLAGLWYKVWHFEGLDSVIYYPDSARRIQYNVIEGIGCTNGPYYPASPYSLTAFSQQLLCFTNDMGITTGLSNPVISYGYNYTGSYDNDSSCIKFYADYIPPAIHGEGIKPLVQTTNNANVVPNPIDNTSKIIFPYSIAAGKLIIVNQAGQAIATLSFQNKDEVTIGDMVKVPGMYFYRLIDNASGKVFSGKFVF